MRLSIPWLCSKRERCWEWSSQQRCGEGGRARRVFKARRNLPLNNIVLGSPRFDPPGSLAPNRRVPQWPGNVLLVPIPSCKGVFVLHRNFVEIRHVLATNNRFNTRAGACQWHVRRHQSPYVWAGWKQLCPQQWRQESLLEYRQPLDNWRNHESEVMRLVIYYRNKCH